MNDWVVDTSDLVKWVLPEPDSATALKVITDTATAGGTVYGLELARIEATNVIWTKLHRKLLNRAEAEKAVGLIQYAPVQTAPSLPLLVKAFDIAAQFDVAVYDALFVAAARELRIGVVTADEPLVRAVGAAFPEIRLLRNW